MAELTGSPTNPFGVQYVSGVGTNYGYDDPTTKTVPLPGLGNAIEWVGDKLGMPEGGISEAIAGGPTAHTDPVQLNLVKTAYAAENDGNVIQAYKDRGWTDENAIRADIANQGDTYKNITGGNQGGTPQKSPTETFKEQYKQSDIMEGQDPNQFLAEIEAIYNEALGLAGKKEGTVRGMAEANKQDIEKQYGVGAQTLGSSKGQALGTINESGISARQRQEQALDAARRLYDEMNRGYQQRFGGASSAGEASRALANIEQQRQMGTTRQGYQDTMRQLETQKLQVEDNYKNELLSLQAKRDSAVNQANQTLNSALLEIESDKALAAQEKALAKMNSLKEYKDKLFNIAQQERAFQQNLDLMREQANIQIGTATQQLASYGQAGQNAYNQFAGSTTLSPTSGLRAGIANTTTNQLTGQVSNDELSKILAMTGQINQAPSYLQKSWSDIPSYFQQ